MSNPWDLSPPLRDFFGVSNKPIEFNMTFKALSPQVTSATVITEPTGVKQPTLSRAKLKNDQHATVLGPDSHGEYAGVNDDGRVVVRTKNDILDLRPIFGEHKTPKVVDGYVGVKGGVNLTPGNTDENLQKHVEAGLAALALLEWRSRQPTLTEELKGFVGAVVAGGGVSRKLQKKLLDLIDEGFELAPKEKA